MKQLTAGFSMPGIESVVKRVALYARVSTKEQALGYSMDGQEEDGIAHIDMSPFLTLFKVYRDPGVSGTKFSRPDLDSLREDIKNGLVDAVLVKAMDRIGRSERVLMPWFWMLEEAGVATISLTQDIDTTTSNGKSSLSVFIAQAQAEWNAIRERTIGGLNAKARSGGWVCGVPPYGYELEGRGQRGGSKVVLHHEEIEILKKAAHCILDKGYSLDRTADALNADSHRTRSGVRWTGPNLRLRLQGPILDGYTEYRSLTNKGTKTATGPDGQPKWGPTERINLPKALDDDLVTKLRNYFEARHTPRGNREHLYFLSGRITGTCGGYSVGRRVTQTGRPMYFCFEHSKNKGARACKYYRADLIEEAVWRSVVSGLGDCRLLERAADNWTGTLPGNGETYTSRIAELDRMISKLDDLRTTKLVEYTTASVDPLVVKAAQDRFEQDIKELESQRAVAQTLLAELENTLDRKSQVLSLATLSSEKLIAAPPDVRSMVVEMLDLKIVFVNDPKNSAVGSPCNVQAFFRDNKKRVPDTLVDEQWTMLVSKIPALSPKGRKISLRTALEAGFYKVRNDIRWRELPQQFGKEMSLRAIWRTWLREGVLADVVDALGDYEGTGINESRWLPEMKIYGVLEGHVDPVIRSDDDNGLLLESQTALQQEP
ncbi:recombinase family protein [Streptomyces sp. NPDC058470]|uniref:recombinase family protein n=1 Tax=Streptomyces sp. NPDC058470 TaxID=3346515 RepID=UPI003660158A